jgi:ribonucleotide reductase alpha subunit
LPQEYKRIYKTIWEISQKQLIKLAAARAPYICQSQSMNIYFAEPSLAKLSASHIFAWEQGLKTGQYYLRSRPAKDAIQFTLDNDALEDKKVTQNLSKADMDKKRREERHAKKRSAVVNVEDVDKDAKVIATNLNKKQRTSVEEPVKAADQKETTGTVEKPWEGKEEKEDD